MKSGISTGGLVLGLVGLVLPISLGCSRTDDVDPLATTQETTATIEATTGHLTSYNAVASDDDDAVGSDGKKSDKSTATNKPDAGKLKDDKQKAQPPRKLSMSKEFNKLNEMERYVILRKGTERAFTGEYWDHKGKGTYICRRCNAPLYKSDTKFDSHCGWPSFDDEIKDAVLRQTDEDGYRTEILCNNCGGHLGHVFLGERFTTKNTRHCVNSLSIRFIPEEDELPAKILPEEIKEAEAKAAAAKEKSGTEKPEAEKAGTEKPAAGAKPETAGGTESAELKKSGA